MNIGADRVRVPDGFVATAEHPSRARRLLRQNTSNRKHQEERSRWRPVRPEAIFAGLSLTELAGWALYERAIRMADQG
jgi:hypothetical protein